MSDDIAYQNKDIIMKILSQNYVDKSLNVYGLDLPKIKQVLSSNLPALKLNEMRSDNIFLLEDDTILIVEYESSDKKENLFKYGHYAFRVAERYLELHGKLYKTVIVVIYTSEVEKASSKLDLGAVQLSVQQVFLSAFDSKSMYQELSQKVVNGEPLTDDDVMRFIILPLTLKNDKQKTVEDTVELAKNIKDEPKRAFIIAGILVSADKFIDKEYSRQVGRWLTMTKIGQFFEEEKLEYANEREKKRTLEIAKNLFDDGIDILSIMKATGLNRAEIEQLESQHIGV